MSEDQAVVGAMLADMLAEPSAGAERVSQALLGEPVAVLEEREGWARVRTPDAYEGWVRAAALVPTPDGGYPPDGRGAVVQPMLAHLRAVPRDWGRPLALVTLGSLVSVAGATHGWRRVRLPAGVAGWMRARHLAVPVPPGDFPPDGAALVESAHRFLGVPYLWGGRSTLGVDCSGLTQRAYALCGMVIPRDAHLQAAWPGFADVSLSAVEAGDLVFFASEEDPRRRGITHVGMAIDGERMVHAAGGKGVCVEPFASPPAARQLVAARRPR
ncbi:MAG TPA: C40 family peptidase [Chthonomonadales bacterium]|nr:C40 family peptidase [Chthonomonadales bacterium]